MAARRYRPAASRVTGDVQRRGDSVLSDDDGTVRVGAAPDVSVAQIVLGLSGMDWRAPDYSMLSQREKCLMAEIAVRLRINAQALEIRTIEVPDHSV